MIAMKSTCTLECNDLICGVDEALTTISNLLENSKQARADYSTNWVKIKEDYEADIEHFESMLQELYSRRRREKNNGSESNSNHHALNFHMQQPDANNSINDMFMLPPATDEMNATSTSAREDYMLSHSLISEVDGDKVCQTKKTLEDRRKEEQKMKFTARKCMLESLDSMRDREVKIELLLKQGEEGDAAPLEDRKRIELQETLDECKQQQSRQIIKWVTSYKPKKNVKTGKKLSQLCPSIKGTLDELKRTQRVRVTEQGNKSNPGGNDKKLCEMIMNDSEQFMNLEDLPFRPLSAAVQNYNDQDASSYDASSFCTSSRETSFEVDNSKILSTSGSDIGNSVTCSDYDDDYEFESDYDDSSFHGE